MKLLPALALLCGCGTHALAGAGRGATVELPRDHGAHDAQTEWWHFHGHLTDQRGGAHDFFLGFVRWHTDRDSLLALPAFLVVDPGQAAVFGLTDRGGRRFFEREKYAWPDVWAAGAAEGELALRHDDWSATATDGGIALAASADGAHLALELGPGKPLVLEGAQGRFESPPHLFYTLPRLEAAGTLTVGGEALAVQGTAWVKHEWGWLYRDDVAGWVWFGVQLDDGSELQVGLIKDRQWRNREGSFAEHIEPAGRAQKLELSELGVVQTGQTWTSPRSGICWPVGWRLELPSGRGALELTTEVPGQELNAFPTAMWAGSLAARGTIDGRPVQGSAMAEVFGLEQPWWRPLYRPGTPAEKEAP